MRGRQLPPSGHHRFSAPTSGSLSPRHGGRPMHGIRIGLLKPSRSRSLSPQRLRLLSVLVLVLVRSTVAAS
jgi:hypothetical protein